MTVTAMRRSMAVERSGGGNPFGGGFGNAQDLGDIFGDLFGEMFNMGGGGAAQGFAGAARARSALRPDAGV